MSGIYAQAERLMRAARGNLSRQARIFATANRYVDNIRQTNAYANDALEGRLRDTGIGAASADYELYPRRTYMQGRTQPIEIEVHRQMLAARGNSNG